MNDEDLLTMYFERDEKALSETRARYGRLIRSVAFGILRSSEDAEECENDVYLRAWNSIPPARPNHLSAYLCKISRGVAIDRWNYLHAAKRGEALPLEELEEALKGTENAEDRFSENRLTELLNSFLKAQDYTTRVIFLRRFWFCDSIADTAKLLHVSQSMVKTRISRTLKKLREYLRENGCDI